MLKDIRVYKFGGASVRDAHAIKNMASIVIEQCKSPAVIVVSAMGKMTNALEAVARAYYQHAPEVGEAFEKVQHFHVNVARELFEEGHEIFSIVNDLFVEIEWVLEEEPDVNYDYVYDQIVPFGELLSTRIVSAYLADQQIKHKWLDARDVIKTDNTYREARVDWGATQQRASEIVVPELRSMEIVLTQGFIGCTSENFTSTLGREGSDYSAAILAFCLDAEKMVVWKDVRGVLSADPRQFENVELIDRMSYREAIEMTYYGAKVIHPKTIKPLQNKSIPMYVRSFEHPADEGTWIGTDIESPLPPIVVTEKHQALVHISTRDYSFVAEHHLGMLFDLFARHRIKINLMRNTAISFTVCCNDDVARLQRFADEVAKDFFVVIDRNLALITVRHTNEPTLRALLQDKVVLLNERFQDTEQFVVKVAPVTKEK